MIFFQERVIRFSHWLLCIKRSDVILKSAPTFSIWVLKHAFLLSFEGLVIYSA
jgi:hypothetical protein